VEGAGEVQTPVRGAADAREVERLAGAKLDSRPQQQRDLLAVPGEAGFDGLLRHRFLARVRCQLEQLDRRIEAPPGDLGGDRMAVGGECARFHQDAGAPARRTIEARQHQVQVHRERIHGDHFGGVRAAQGCEPGAQVLVIRHPRPPCVLVAQHAKPRPLIELLQHEFAGRERQQPQ